MSVNSDGTAFLVHLCKDIDVPYLHKLQVHFSGVGMGHPEELSVEPSEVAIEIQTLQR